MNVSLRKFPYPYQAALAICSDVDGTSWEDFLTIHKFLNSSQSTELGDGLSLNIADSFWMYDLTELPEAAFSYFKNSQGKETTYAPIIRDLIRAGIIDVMHSYGNFASATDFSRSIAYRALNELEKHKLKLTVWTNHGGVESTQNIGAQSVGKGDIKINGANKNETSYYHVDLLLDYGLRFYWDCELSLTTIVGQDVLARFNEAYWGSPLYNGVANKLKSAAKGLITLADILYSKIFNSHFIPWQPYHPENTLLSQDQLRDGSRLFKFKRFGNGRLDWSDNFPFLLNDKVLEKLLDKNGYLILYIHLGDKKNKNCRQPLTTQTVEKFRQLAELHRAGKIWVETTSRLLNYNRVYHGLNWTVTEKEFSYHIHIDDLKNEKKSELSVDDLRGISFLFPPNKGIDIFLNDRAVPVKIYFDADANQQVATVPLTSIEWPL